MTTTATAVSEFGIKVTGAEAAAREMSKVKAAVDANTKAANDNASAQKKIEEAAKRANVSIGQFGSSLGLTGQALGRVNPAMGQLVTMAGSATGVIQTLTTAGLGPLGIALSAVSVAVSAGVTVWDNYTEAQRRLEDRVRTTTIPTINELVAKMREASDQAAQLARLNAGSGSVEEYRANEQRGREYARSLRDRIQRARNAGGTTAFAIPRLEAELQRAEQINETRAEQRRAAEARDAAAREANPLGIIEESSITTPTPSSVARSAPRSGGASRRDIEQQRLDRLMQSAGAPNALASLAGGQMGLSDPEKERIRLEEQLNEERIAKAQAAADRQIEIEQQLTDAMNAEADKRQRAVEAEAQARVEAIERTSAIMGAAGNAITGVYGFIDDASKKSDETEEQKQKRQLRRIGVEQAIQAVVNAANAAASFARYDIPAGISYTAAAALNVAAAAKAGVDAGNVKASPAGGMRPDSPTQRSGSREPQSIVVNLSGPVIATADRAALGRELSGLVDEGRARYAS